MKRPQTTLAAGLALIGALLVAPMPHALAGQQTFSSVSSGAPPAPYPTATSLGVSGVYLGIYPGNAPLRPFPPCQGSRCKPPVHKPMPNRPPVTTNRPVAPPPVPRPALPRP